MFGRTFSVLIICGIGLAWSQSTNRSTLAIENVTVIDGTGTPSRPGMTVLIENGKIAAIQQTSTTRLASATWVVQARGKYLIPGLWDSHVHALWDANRPAQFFPLFLANGVTNVREMGGPMPAAEQVRWRQRVVSGDIVGPDLVVPGPFVDGPTPIWPGSIAVGDAQQARKAVDELKESGVDFIKVYSQLPREAYLALAGEARMRNIPFAGHVPLLVDVDEASDAGQLSIEHLMGVLLETSSSGDELKKKLLAGANINELNNALVDTFDPARAGELFQRFVRNGTWQVPTLTIRHSRPYLAELAAAHDFRLQFMASPITAGWAPRDDPRQPGTQAAIDSRKKLYRKELEVVGAMNRAGVRIAAGTDAPNPYCFPGFSLHDELAFLVEAGLSPMQALQSATRNAAELTGRISRLGTIEKGKDANMVILDADPLVDIHNTRRIDSVILHGRLYTRTELDGMLEQVASIVK